MLRNQPPDIVLLTKLFGISAGYSIKDNRRTAKMVTIHDNRLRSGIRPVPKTLVMRCTEPPKSGFVVSKTGVFDSFEKVLHDDQHKSHRKDIIDSSHVGFGNASLPRH